LIERGRTSRQRCKRRERQQRRAGRGIDGGDVAAIDTLPDGAALGGKPDRMQKSGHRPVGAARLVETRDESCARVGCNANDRRFC